MKIACVSPFDPRPATHHAEHGHVGGVERALWNLCTALARAGHDATLVCSSDGQAGESRHEGVRVVRATRRLTVLRAPVAPLAALVPQDADLVHVAATYPFTTPHVLRRARRLGAASVLDFHFEPHLDSLAGRAALHAYRLVGPPSYELADAVIVRSLEYGRSSPSLARVPETRWHVVPNGIDPDRFRPSPSAASGDYVLFVGRLVPYKGIPVLLDAMARWPSAPPLVIAGDGPLRAALERTARRRGVDARFLGPVPDRDLPSLYRGARLTVLPSVNRQEAFGMTLLESMACGTPVVASDLPGVAQVARLGGRVAAPGDAQALVTTLRGAWDPAVLPRGAGLANRIRRKYSWDAVARRTLNVYEHVLARRDGAPLASARRRAVPCASSP